MQMPSQQSCYNFMCYFLQTLANPDCYHEFCRLLLRIKSNYQLGELLKLDDYSKFIELIAKFTVSSLQVGRMSKIAFLFVQS